MSGLQALILYALLGLLGLSLLVPGLVEVLRAAPGTDSGLATLTVAGRSHLRGLNAMMAALGLVALWACWDLEHARTQVLVLGLVMAMVVAGRLCSLWQDGFPGPVTAGYLLVEVVMAVAFLGWPPPR